MRVALVHDWLTGNRGGEKVLLELVRLFPRATLHTLFHFPGTVPSEIEALDIRTTFLQRLTRRRTFDYRKLLPLFPIAAETWDFEGAELVLSSSHCVAKNARAPRGALHFCYSHTPVRYLHDQFDAYFEKRSEGAKLAARMARSPLRAWDVATATRPDAFIANSENVRERIERLYGRQSAVVSPPVDVDFFIPPSPSAFRKRTGFLVVSALVPYKRIEDAIEATMALRAPLTIVGTGPEEQRLRSLAGPSVSFAGAVTAGELLHAYQGAEAVLMPGEEDFGIVPVEAQASGTPVIALGLGGANETVIDGVTGILYSSAGKERLARAIEQFRSRSFETARLTENASRFSRDRFRKALLEALAEAANGSQRSDLAEKLRSLGGAPSD